MGRKHCSLHCSILTRRFPVLDPAAAGEPANPFATPLESLPGWYFYPVFHLLRTVPNQDGYAFTTRNAKFSFTVSLQLIPSPDSGSGPQGTVIIIDPWGRYIDVPYNVIHRNYFWSRPKDRNTHIPNYNNDMSHLSLCSESWFSL